MTLMISAISKGRRILHRIKGQLAVVGVARVIAVPVVRIGFTGHSISTRASGRGARLSHVKTRFKRYNGFCVIRVAVIG